MLVDQTILGHTETQYELVVVGGGAAGLTLAHRAGQRGLRTLVVEAGSSRETKSGRKALDGELVNPAVHPALNLYRVRALGGTSRIWGGRCIPLDPIDFEVRDWVAGSGWPIPYAEIDQYYPAAMQIAEAGSNLNDPSAVLAGMPSELVRGLDGPLMKTTLERFSRPTNFWTRLSRDLHASKHVHVLPQAKLKRISLHANGASVRTIVVMTQDGREHELQGRSFALALGGLETVRMLMASSDVRRAGIGNDHDTLGRYYMSHLCANGASIDVASSADALASDYARDHQGIYVRRRLWLTEDAQRQFRLANMTFRTHVPDPGDPAHRNAILSAMFLSKFMVQKEYAAKFSQRQVPLSAYVKHAANIARNPLVLSRFARLWMKERVLADRKLPSVVLRSADHRYPLEFHSEQFPNPDSRVLLSSERDSDGVPQLKVDWKVLDADVEGLVRAHQVLASEIRRTNTGLLTFDADELRTCVRTRSIVGGHHIGTTRMSSDPRTGVVDKNCRVHGVANLFIASSSVMPTSGQGNPTLTIVALALRLADYLAETLASRDRIGNVAAETA